MDLQKKLRNPLIIRYLYIYLFLQFSYQISFAQNNISFLADTIKPNFELKVCANNNITLTILPKANMNYDKFLIDWGDNSVNAEIYSVNSSLSKTYTENNTHFVSVTGHYFNGYIGASASKKVNFIPNPTVPIISKITSIDARNSEFEIKNPSNLSFQLFQNENSAGFSATGTTITTSGIYSIKANNSNSTCYKLISNNACLANLSSTIACNATLKIETESDKNKIAWDVFGSDNVQIFRNQSEILLIPDPTIREFNDKSVLCETQYCYQIIANSANFQAISEKKCLTNNLLSCESSTIYIPSAFTPNGDGVNDELEIKGDAKYFISLQIFDRWGSQIADFQDITTKWQGNNLPNGDYLYRLNSKTKTGESFEKIGTISILR